MRDVHGTLLPAVVWHGATAVYPEGVMVPAAEFGRWWNVMDHGEYLNPQYSEDDQDQRAELDVEVRTAYANAVYEAFLRSEDPDLRDIATSSGLDGIGEEIGILFVSGDSAYVERYGEVREVDLDADGILAAIPDDNIAEERLCWMLVMRAGAPFPFLAKASPSP